MSATRSPSLERGARRQGRRFRGFDRPRVLWGVAAAVIVFEFLPVLVVMVYSFNSHDSLFQMHGLSLRWYHEAVTSSAWLKPLWVSIEIALITTAVCAVTGTLLALGLQRGTRPVAQATDGMLVLRLVTPETATAFASLLLFTQIGLLLSRGTIILAHIALCIPFVTVIVRSQLAGLNPDLEESAMDLGASRWRAIRLVVLPVIWPSIAAASLLTFVLSFDDFITSVFTSGSGVPPLPLQIYTALRQGVTPVVNAIGMLMMVGTIAVVGIAIAVERAGRRPSVASSMGRAT